MIQEYVYAPHYDFYIDKIRRESTYNMDTFHMHKKYEIYYQIAGTRKFFIEDSAYFVNTGDFVLVDKDEVHKTSSPDDSPYTRIVLNFNEKYIAPIAERLDGLDIFEIFRGSIKVLSVDRTHRELMEDILERLLKLEKEKKPESTALCQLLMCELLLYLKKCIDMQKAKQVDDPKIKNKTIDEITVYIAKGYKQKLTLESIAQKYGLSTYYLSRLFKKTTNMSLTEYINSVRIRAAKDLLETTSLKISQIAQETGFTTTAHFTRMFKSGTGMAPHDYRKSYRIQQE